MSNNCVKSVITLLLFVIVINELEQKTLHIFWSRIINLVLYQMA